MKDEDKDFPLTAFLSIIKQQSIIYLNKRLEEENITAGQTPYLVCLLHHKKMCQDDLAKHYKQDKSVVARGMRKLEDNNLISKEVDETNRRKSVISLSDEGKKVAKRIVEINEEWEEALCNELNLPREEVAQTLGRIAKTSIEINKKEDKNGRSP